MTAARTALAALLAVACAGCAGTSGAAAPAAPVPAPVAAAPAPERPAPGTAAEEPLLDSRPATLDALRREQGTRPVAVLVPGSRRPAPVEVRTTDPVGGGLDLPDDAATVAWWGSGTAPGEPRGSAVLAAHVSYEGQTGPFTRLASVRAGAPVVVTSEDGTRHRYRVESVRSAPKTALDREELFRTSGRPALVLVTCGGRFDPATRSYESNVVVTAAPA